MFKLYKERTAETATTTARVSRNLLRVWINFKVFTLLGVIAMFGFNAMAQDIIVLKDSNEINALVQEIGINEVKYKKWDNQTGPTYTMKKSEVFMIKYQNGTKDVFNEIAKPIETNEQPLPAGSVSRYSKAIPEKRFKYQPNVFAVEIGAGMQGMKVENINSINEFHAVKLPSIKSQ